ncbi:hypothetical protein [Salidesulfovibrio onnuriiensis]|uniref:hypothetical protein n=1 Tax=Salidesulfovibrio onnuriiensis TaxID=2583823 RepID=UPI0011CBA913|nr:hypothetical protein [Salidesulfovibrio onnuriiensis]
MISNGGNRDAALEQELQGLRRQYEALRDRKVRVEQDIVNLTAQLDELKARAEAEYKTSDPEELRKLLEEKRQENERVVAEYRQHINELQQGLQAVEQAFRNNGNS